MTDDLWEFVPETIRAASEAEAQQAGHPFLGTEHLFLSLMAQPAGPVHGLLQSRGLEEARLRISVLAEAGEAEPHPQWAGLRITPRLRHVLALACTMQDQARTAQPEGKEGTEEEKGDGRGEKGGSDCFLLAALLQEGEGVAARVLRRCGLDLSQEADHLFRPAAPEPREGRGQMGREGEEGREGERETREHGDTQTPRHPDTQTRDSGTLGTLGTLGTSEVEQRLEQVWRTDLMRDLTHLASMGHLRPLVPRPEDTDALIQVLLRQERNKPLLVGPAGSGKTALAEDLAQRIVAEEVPARLVGRRLCQVRLRPGTHPWDVQHLAQVLYELIERLEQGEPVLLFLDDLEAVFAPGLPDLLPGICRALFRRDAWSVFAAMEDLAYTSCLASDPTFQTFARVLHPATPDNRWTARVAQAHRPHLEHHYGVQMAPEAGTVAADLTAAMFPHLRDHPFISRALPAAALDVLHEACSQVAAQASAHSPLPVGGLGGQMEMPIVTAAAVRIVLAEWSGRPDLVPVAELRQRVQEEINRCTRHAEAQGIPVRVASPALDFLVEQLIHAGKGDTETRRHGDTETENGLAQRPAPTNGLAQRPAPTSEWSVRRAMVRLFQEPLADRLARGDLTAGQALVAATDGTRITFAREGEDTQHDW